MEYFKPRVLTCTCIRPIALVRRALMFISGKMPDKAYNKKDVRRGMGRCMPPQTFWYVPPKIMKKTQ